MIFCPNEYACAGSGEGEGCPDRCPVRTHAAHASRPSGTASKLFGGKPTPGQRHRLPSRALFECRMDSLPQKTAVSEKAHLNLSLHILKRFRLSLDNNLIVIKTFEVMPYDVCNWRGWSGRQSKFLSVPAYLALEQPLESTARSRMVGVRERAER
ncbi:jg13575 [Pararge aegeria aegeria]|uniref:Jg13575 protein n=1 Tax=Pararge aegeria aegeria TaxID=348720 RepID=A0A8S4QUY8_9NEOP|nr:jg13575 [Pararge aegeria aegeria]